MTYCNVNLTFYSTLYISHKKVYETLCKLPLTHSPYGVIMAVPDETRHARHGLADGASHTNTGGVYPFINAPRFGARGDSFRHMVRSRFGACYASVKRYASLALCASLAG